MRTNPDPLHVEGDSIRRDPLVVSGLEDEVVPSSVDEAFPEVLDGVLELFGHEHLVRESGESKVEVVGELSVLESVGLVRGKTKRSQSQRSSGEEKALTYLCKRVPDLLHVLGERRLKVAHGGGSDVVSNDEHEESLLLPSVRTRRGRESALS